MTRKKPLIRVFENGTVHEEYTEIALEISNFVKKKFKLSYEDINFYLVNDEERAKIVAGGGWINNMEHWSLGQEYEIQKVGHALGNWRVYEIVVPSGVWNGRIREPVEAYIYKGNTLNDIKLVMAHVYGHAHIFHNNFYQKKFAPESPHAMMFEHKKRYSEIEDIIGEGEVEDFMDMTLVLGNLIDIQGGSGIDHESEGEKGELEKIMMSHEERREELIKILNRKDSNIELPAYDDYNILNFLVKNCNIPNWQKEILSMVEQRNKFIYSVGECKIVHEGFAALIDYLYAVRNKLPMDETFQWLNHRTNGLMHERDNINPYRLGLDLFMSVLHKFGTGRYGFNYENELRIDKRVNPEYLFSDDITKLDFNEGWEQVLTIAASYKDFSFIDQCFNKEFFNRYGKNFFTYEENITENWNLIPDNAIISRGYNEIKNALLFKSFNLGYPRIFINKGGVNFDDKGGLYLVHDRSIPLNLNLEPRNITLDPGYTHEVLKAVNKIWKQPVYLETIDQKNDTILMSYSEKEGFREQLHDKKS